MRPHQWYKNLVVFLAIFFAGKATNIDEVLYVGLGFLVLCIVSSANYIFNDIIDKKKDALNVEKKNRPIASGKISTLQGVILGTILLVTGLYFAYHLNNFFFFTVLSLFVLSSIYSTFLKNIAPLDIIIISTNFVIRAIAGVALIHDETISPWLVIGTFFLSLSLATGKRESEIKFLKNISHRETLSLYKKEITHSLMIISTTILIICFALYSFLSQYKNLIFVLPLFVYLIFRYLFLIESASEIARHPEKIYKDKEMIIGILITGLATITIVYFL